MEIEMKAIRLSALLMAVITPCLLAAENPADAKTYALVIGISRYQKLPKDLWLQYPDADAKAFSDHLSSPRGGSVPPRENARPDERARDNGEGARCIPDVSQNRPGQE